MGIIMKSVLAFHNCSLSVVLYFYALINLKKPLTLRTFVQQEGARFWSSGLYLSMKSYGGHGLLILGDLKLVASAPCKPFGEQSGTSASGIPHLGPCSILEIVILTYSGIH